MERNINSKIYIEKVEKGYFADQPTLPNSISSIKGFVGREGYLAELREFYQKGSRCFVLHGIGGVGKSALALQFAEEVAGEYAAKILVDMRGMSKNPLSARDAMLAIVREFERDTPAEIPDVQLKSLFISKVQNQETLIVLDNAANVEAVESLNQTKACLIITSRQSFVLTNSKIKQIAKMLPEDARRLLFENGGGEERFDGRADELAELAGYLPMALKPLAALLREDEMETAAALIERYRNKQELLKERVPDYDNLTIEASFELSYEALPEELQKRWQRLSVFPADFDEVAISYVLKISEDEAKATQTLLRKYSLLEVNNETKRFELHDLIRAFTNIKLIDEELLDVQYLHANYYALILQIIEHIKSNDLINGYMSSLNIINIEWDNIKAGQKFTIEFAEKNDGIAALCMDYSSYALDFISFRLHPRQNVLWVESGLTAARKLGDYQREGIILTALGNVYMGLGEYRKANECFEQSLMISREVNDRMSEGINLGNIGLIYNYLDEYRKAIESTTLSLEISRELNNRLLESNNLGYLGISYNSLGEYKKAIEFYEQSLSILPEIGDRKVESYNLGNLGNAYENLGDYGKAIEYHSQSLRISREINNLEGEGISLGNLGNIYSSLGNHRKAIEYYEQSLVIWREMNNRVQEGTLLGNLGLNCMRIGEYHKAIEYQEQSLAISREFKDILGEGINLVNLGSNYQDLGDREKACGLWKEALAIFEEIESPYADVVIQALEKNCRNKVKFVDCTVKNLLS